MQGQLEKTFGQHAAKFGMRAWVFVLSAPRWPKKIARMCSRQGRALLGWRLRHQPLTWDRLKDVKLDVGGGIVNLQDYWRLGPGGQILREDKDMARELVLDSRGRTWHIAHLPPWIRLADGQRKTTWNETQWNELEAIVQARIDDASATDTTIDAAPLRVDRRARLDGCFLRVLPKPSGEGDLHIACPDAHFSKTVKLPGVKFASTPNFAGAMFKHGALFNKAQFPKGAHFRDAVFGRNADFQEAQFGGRADFQGIVVCLMALFGSRPDDRTKTKFSDVAKFNRARFLNGANFNDIEFGDKSAFDDAVFARRSDFERCVFTGAAIFERASFYRRASFAFAKFKRSVTFARAQFHGRSDFEDAELPGDMSFDRAQFTAIERMLNAARVWFWIALAFAAWTYLGTPWPEALAFHKAWIFAFPALIYLTSSFLISKDSQLAARMWFVLALGLVVWAYFGAPAPDHLAPYRVWIFALPAGVCLAASSYMAKDGKVEPFERSYSYLAAQVEKAGNRKDAALLLRKHQRAKRLRRRHPLPGRILSIAYDIAASYGDSLRRPTFWLLMSLAAFAALFWTWSNGGPRDVQAWIARVQHAEERAELFGAVEFSLANVVQPFATWAPALHGDQDCNFRTNLLVVGARKTTAGVERCRPVWMDANADLNGHRLAVRTMSALQSIVSALLLFLMALATRRRFSIS
ncbi:MAG: pentapeptide repeat-containing protein [Phycisphaerales bacterium]|nr:pentapeptide repeat-containing protein [Hyphomonadaceae bacterium]